MKRKNMLSKALSVLLSGAILIGTIPTTIFAEETLPEAELVKAETTKAVAGFHTLDGYLSEWSYSFENGFDGTSWKSEDKDKDTYGWGVSLAPPLSHCGDRVMVSESYYWIQETNEDVPLDPDNWLYSPKIQLAEDKVYKLTFNMRGWGNTFGVFVSKDINHTDYVQLGSDYTIPSDSDWHEYTIDLSEYAGDEIKLAFVHHNNSSDRNLFLDCVDISGKPKGYTMTRSWGFEDTVFEDEEWGVADVPTSFIAADKDKDGDTWEVLKSDWYAHSGQCLVRARGSADVKDNWLRLPKLWLDNDKDYLLTFYVSDSFAYQTVDVYLYGDKCCDGNVTPEDLDGDGIQEYFSKVLTEEIAIVGKVSGWHEVKVDLSDYADQYVYAAIVQHGGEGEMRVDDIALWKRDAHTADGDRTNVYFEGFENEDGKLPEGWDTLDKDGDNYDWYAYYGGPHKKHHGKGVVYSHSYNDGALTPDNWLVMPSYKVSTTKKTTLTFEAVGSYYKDYNEVFGVYISVDGGKFWQIGKDYTTSYVWQEVEVDLTPYAGKSVRVAVVHHNCTDQERLLLDCFNIWEEPFPPIKSADITLPKPTVGEAVPKTNFADVKVNVEEYGISVSANDGIWQKLSKEVFQSGKYSKYEEIADGEKFSEDYVYFLDVYFEIDKCYTFAGEDEITLTVNGLSGYYEMDKTTVNNYLRVGIIFYPFEAYITDVSATVTEPVVGAVPDTSPVVKFTPDKELLHVAMWVKAPKEDYTTYAETVWETISDPTETFAEGYVYAVIIGAANEGMEQYEFTPDTTVSINGKTALPMENDEDGYYMSPSLIGGAAVFDLSSTKPQNVKATAGDSKVTLSWNAVGGATSYRVYRSNTLTGAKTLLKAVTTTTYSDETVESGKTYYYFVVSYNSKTGEKSEYSDGVSVTIPVPPAKPTNVKAVSGGGNVTVTWDAVENATSYRVFRSDSLTGARELLKVRTSLYYIDTEVDTGKTYYYWIMAYNATTGLKSAYSSSASVKVVDTFPEDISIKSASVLSTSVTLKWDIVPGATSYRIYRRNDDGSRKLLAAQSMTEYKDTGLTKGKVYKYEIRAYSKTTGALSNYSPIKQVRPMAAPTILSGNVKGKITWEKNAVATSYRVYRADSLTGAKKLLAPTTLLTYTDTTAEKGKTYYYFVAAYDSSTGTLSAYSQAKVITIA